MGFRVLFGLVCFVVLRYVKAYNCTECDKSRCLPESTPCPGNWAIDPCGCCRHCARQEWEVCGGNNWELGYCDHRTRCAAVIGTGLVQIPDVGVCKWLPDYSYFVEEDEICPEQHGCYKRTGVCDCYTKNTCIDDFRFSNHDICYKHTDAGYDPVYFEGIEICWNQGCEIRDKRCLCEFGKCRTQYTFKDQQQCKAALAKILCGNITCPEMPQRNCSRDSVASKPYIPPGECCPTIPSFCTCDYDKCKHGCDQHSTKKEMILKGEGVPGKCCDHFKCVPASDTQEKEADLK